MDNFKYDENIITSIKYRNIEYINNEYEDSINKTFFKYLNKTLCLYLDFKVNFYFLYCQNVDSKLNSIILLINLKLSKFIIDSDLDIIRILNLVDNGFDKSMDKISKKLVLTDKFNLFSKDKIKTKFLINESLLKSNFDKIVSKIDKSKYKLNKIPSNLINQNKVFMIIKSNLKEVNENFNYEHYIVPENNNPFNLLLRFRFTQGKISECIKKLNLRKDSEFLEIKLILDPLLHPYIPPKISYNNNIYMKPKLLFSILDIDFLKSKNWNPFLTLDWIILNLGKNLETLFVDNFVSLNEYNLYDKNKLFLKKIIIFNDLIKSELYEKIIFNMEFNNLSLKLSKNKGYLPEGTGYGYGSSDWDYKELDKKNKEDEKKIIKCLSYFFDNISSDNIDHIIVSTLPNYFLECLRNNILYVNKHLVLYTKILEILEKIIVHDIPTKLINNIYSNLNKLFIESKKYMEMDVSENNDELLCYKKIENVFNIYSKKETNKIKALELPNLLDHKEKFKKMVFKHIYDDKDGILSFKDYKLPISHKMHKKKNDSISLKSLKRIKKEIFMLRERNSIPIEWDSSILLRVPNDKMNIMTFIITGPKDTPYHNGLFEFHVYFPDTYPMKPPHVLFCTNGNGTVRMNPNLYANEGKTCLSLLGTWHTSQDSEGWIPSKSNLLQVMTSIQAMILGESHPYFNEPTYEKEFGKSNSMKKSKRYNDEKRYFTIKWAINNNIENPPISFEDFVTDYFIEKEKEILEVIQLWLDESDNYKEKIKLEMLKTIELINKLKEKKYNKKNKIDKILFVSKKNFEKDDIFNSDDSEETIKSNDSEEIMEVLDSDESIEINDAVQSIEDNKIE